MTPDEYKTWKKSMAAYAEFYARDATSHSRMADQVASFSPRRAAIIRGFAEGFRNMAILAREIGDELADEGDA